MDQDAASGFRVDTVSSGSMVILALHGELDISGQSPLMAEVDRVMQRNPMVLAIDLRGLAFMDSSGVDVLISAGRRCQRDGQRFFIIRGAPAIDRLLTPAVSTAILSSWPALISSPTGSSCSAPVAETAGKGPGLLVHSVA